MTKFSSFVKRIKRRWILKPGSGPSDPEVFKREQERAEKELKLAALEPTQHTDLESTKSRKIPKKAIEQARGAHRGPVLQTIEYQQKDGKYVLNNKGELIPEIAPEDQLQPNEDFLTDK